MSVKRGLNNSHLCSGFMMILSCFWSQIAFASDGESISHWLFWLYNQSEWLWVILLAIMFGGMLIPIFLAYLGWIGRDKLKSWTFFYDTFVSVVLAIIIVMISTKSWSTYSHHKHPPSTSVASVKLAWNISSSSNVGGYIILYGKNSRNYTANIDVGNNTAYTISGLQEGTKYYFVVKAYDSARTIESSYSNEVNLTIPVAVIITADFTTSAKTGVASFVTNFTPVTTGAVTNWTWRLPGSTTPFVTTSTAQVVSAIYPSPGKYSVSLTATGSRSRDTKTYPNLITVTVPPPITPPPPVIAPPPVSETSLIGLVVAYGFEELSGATVADASGNGNHGTIKEAVSITKGHSGRALKFDGVNDWITVNDSASLDFSTGMSIEAWVYPQLLTSGGKTVIIKEASGAQVYALYASEDVNKPVYYFNDGSYFGVAGLSALPLNQWTHLVGNYDGQYQRLYVNGKEVANSKQNSLIQQSTGVLRIGGNSLWGEYFKGYIDEVRLYNRALTAAEVNYNMATAISVSNPAHFVMGNMTQEPWVAYKAQGSAQAYQTIPQKTGVVMTLQIYLDASSTAKELVAGIYQDNNGHPGTLVAQGKLSTLRNEHEIT